MLSRRLLNKTSRLPGVGIHSGMPSWIEILPSSPSSGISFLSMDKKDVTPIPAVYLNVSDSSSLCTKLGNKVSTVEHVMAALYGLHVLDALCVISGDEVPILDGCAFEFIQALEQAGLEEEKYNHKMLRIKRSVQVENGSGFARLDPLASTLRDSKIFEVHLECNFKLRGDNVTAEKFSYSHDWTSNKSDMFIRDLSKARTFVFQEDIPKLHAQGLGKGGNKTNCVVFSNDTGQAVPDFEERYSNNSERVRHKTLDVMGDLALAGSPIVGRFTGKKTGHALNHACLVALFADERNFEYIL